MLNQRQIDTFHTKGYLVLNDIMHDKLPAVVSEYETAMDHLCASWGLRGVDFEDKVIRANIAGYDWFQPLDISLPGDRIYANTPMHQGPGVFDMITAPRLLDIIQDLIGPEITSNPIQHVRIKPPAPTLREDETRAHVTSTDWHQDRGVTLEEADETDMITVWIAVTDATEENGCLQVKPFKGQPELLPHCPKKQTAIADAFVDEVDVVTLPVRAGSVILLHPLIPHASLPNQTRGIRWSFDIRFNKTGQPTGRSHFPEFVVRSEANPSSVMTDWREWREMWEAARARLAVSPHTEIHRWTSDAPYCA